MPIVATGLSSRDQDHRRALQSLLSGKLPRADRHHLGLRRRLDAVLPDGCAAARRVDEAASGRTPGGLALRDRQTGWQGSLGWKAASPVVLNRLIPKAAITDWDRSIATKACRSSQSLFAVHESGSGPFENDPTARSFPLIGGDRKRPSHSQNDAIDPDVWSDRALQEDFVELAAAVLHQCIRPLIGACCAPGHHGYQRACVLISGQASIGPFGSPVFARARKTDPPFCLVLSQTVLVSSKARPLASTAQAMRKVWVWSVNLDQPDAQASAIYLGLTRGGIRDEH